MSNFRGVMLRGDRGGGQSRHKLTTTDPNRTTKDVKMTRPRTCHWDKHEAMLQHIQWNKGRKGTVTVQLTHASRGICSRPSSPGGCVLATPRERDDHQGDGTPSLSVFNHKEHEHAFKRFSHHSYELSHPLTSHTHTYTQQRDTIVYLKHGGNHRAAKDCQSFVSRSSGTVCIIMDASI